MVANRSCMKAGASFPMRRSLLRNAGAKVRGLVEGWAALTRKAYLILLKNKLLRIRVVIDTDTAHIRQYDKRRVEVLVIANMLPLKISVIGNTYRYLGNRHLDADSA